MKVKHMRIAIDIDSTMNQAYHYDYIVRALEEI